MITILMYHQIADIPKILDPLGLAISPFQFEQQMNFLARNGYTCLTLADAVQSLQEGKQMSGKFFVLTFDDGYHDVYSTACPIIEKFGFTATIFLVANCMGSLGNWWVEGDTSASLLLSQDEARKLSQRGFIFGSHTLSHPFLNKLDEDSAFNEIFKSKIILQSELDTSIDYFSYPYSVTNPHIEQLVKLAGYKAACAGDRGPWSLFHMWRVPCLRTDSLLTFSMKASGLYGWQSALRESASGRILHSGIRLLRCIISTSNSRGSYE